MDLLCSDLLKPKEKLKSELREKLSQKQDVRKTEPRHDDRRKVSRYYIIISELNFSDYC